jgi:uncharacterized membrane protein
VFIFNSHEPIQFKIGCFIGKNFMNWAVLHILLSGGLGGVNQRLGVLFFLHWDFCIRGLLIHSTVASANF